jgi:uncharacterized protein YkwD
MQQLLGPVFVLAAALLAACEPRQDKPVQPPPARQASAPGAGAVASGPGALPAPAGANCGLHHMPQEVLERVNSARASGHRCGPRAMGPTSALKWDADLYSAAAAHSRDMARRNYFDHRSPEGKDVAARAAASRYRWTAVGENISRGDRSVAEVLQTWLDSPEHCENIMKPDFDDVAVACVAQAGTQHGTYWTMVLGRRRA